MSKIKRFEMTLKCLKIPTDRSSLVRADMQHGANQSFPRNTDPSLLQLQRHGQVGLPPVRAVDLENWGPQYRRKHYPHSNLHLQPDQRETAISCGQR